MRCPACDNILYFDWCDECEATLEDIVADLEEDGDEDEEDGDAYLDYAPGYDEPLGG